MAEGTAPCFLIANSSAVGMFEIKYLGDISGTKGNKQFLEFEMLPSFHNLATHLPCF